MSRAAIRLAAAAAGLALSAGCEQSIELFPSLAGPARDGGVTDGRAGAGDGGACAPIHLGGSEPSACASALAASALRYALCTCDSMSPRGRIRTQAFDSDGNTVPARRAAALGSNRFISHITDLDAGGALTSAEGITLFSDGQVAETLRAGGALQLGDRLTVSGDAFVGAWISGPLTVAGTLHMNQGFDSGGATAARIVRERVTIPRPCPCGRTISPAALVAARAARNDNASAGLTSTSLTDVRAPRRLDLPCGEMYLSTITTSADVTLAVHGHAALFVDGAIDLGGSLLVELDPGAELDVVSTASLRMRAGSRIGDLEHPARTRIWLGGYQLAFFNSPTVAAAIHAPEADLSARAGLALRGAVLVAEVLLDGATLDLTYDRAVLGGGARTCNTTPQAPIE